MWKESDIGNTTLSQCWHGILEPLRVVLLYHTQMNPVGTDFCSLWNLNIAFLLLCVYNVVDSDFLK